MWYSILKIQSSVWPLRSDHQKSPTELPAGAVQREEAQSLSDTAGCVNGPNGEGITHTVGISVQMNPVIIHADLWGLKPVWVSFSVGLKNDFFFSICMFQMLKVPI